jgi:hypothetical protein
VEAQERSIDGPEQERGLFPDSTSAEQFSIERKEPGEVEEKTENYHGLKGLWETRREEFQGTEEGITQDERHQDRRGVGRRRKRSLKMVKEGRALILLEFGGKVIFWEDDLGRCGGGGFEEKDRIE